MRRELLIILFVFGTSISQAQIHEIGIFVGGTNYVGDIGKTSYILQNKLGGGIIYKRNINTRIALRGTLSYLPIEANDALSTNSGRKNRNFEDNSGEIIDEFEFKNNIIELAAGIEYNFFEYDVESSNKTFTPYILLELVGFTYKSTTFDISNDISKKKIIGKNKISFAIPFGLGFKVKLLNNITFAIETKFRYTFKDDLDSTSIDNLDSTSRDNLPDAVTVELINNDVAKNFEDRINGNGNDWYMFTGFSFIYTFGEVFGKPIWYSK